MRERTSRKAWILVTLLLVGGVAFAIPPTRIDPGIDFGDGSATAVSASGRARLRYNNSTHVFEQSLNGAAYTTLGGAGGSSTLATAYTTGASQTDSTMLLDSTRLGIRIRDNATPITGSLFQVQSSAGGSTFLDINAASSLALRSGMADGASAVGTIIDTTAAWANATSKVISIRNGGVEQAFIDKFGDWIMPIASSGMFTSTGYTVGFGFVSSYLQLYGAGSRPNADVASQLGDATHRWTDVFSRRFEGVSQSMAFSATPAFDCTAGETIHIGTITGNVTGPTMVAGAAGERCTIIFLKDATAGTYTINGWGSNTRTAGVMTFTATASTVFAISFVWDDRLGTPQWVETSRVGPI